MIPAGTTADTPHLLTVCLSYFVFISGLICAKQEFSFGYFFSFDKVNPFTMQIGKIFLLFYSIML
jgi:hypothetical protein